MTGKPIGVMLAMLSGLLFAAASGSAADESGKALFEQHCAICHPSGGNIINPQKPLDRKTLAANGINNADDIIAIMRKPGPGMTPFGPGLIPDEQAKEVAEYILETF